MPKETLSVPRVKDVLDAELDYKNKKLTQFDIKDFYLANYKDPSKPIQIQHGLQNFSSVKLGDNRIFYESSLSADTYNPPMVKTETDFGLSEEIKLANRERDYAYALECTADKDLGFIEKTIKEKLRERTKTGPFQLRKTFKYFDREGKGGITFPELRFAFELMGFSFTETQVLALFAQYDQELRGEIGYKVLIDRLMEKDFMEVAPIWLKPKRKEQGILPPPEPTHEEIARFKAQKALEQETIESLAFEREECHKLFEFANRSDTGYMDHNELQLFLLLLGRVFNEETLQATVCAVDPENTSHISFDTFWGWLTNTE